MYIHTHTHTHSTKCLCFNSVPCAGIGNENIKLEYIEFNFCRWKRYENYILQLGFNGKSADKFVKKY